MEFNLETNAIDSLEQELRNIELSDNSEYDPKEAAFNVLKEMKEDRRRKKATKKKFRYKKKR